MPTKNSKALRVLVDYADLEATLILGGRPVRPPPTDRVRPKIGGVTQPTAPPPSQPAPQTTTRTLPKDSSMVAGLRLAKILPWLVYLYLLLEVIVLTLAFFLLLFNASTDAEFTQWVYRSADRALEPFRGIFPSATADNGSVLDFAVLFAIIVYGILAMLAQSLIHWIDRKIFEERAKARWLAEGTTITPPPG